MTLQCVYGATVAVFAFGGVGRTRIRATAGWGLLPQDQEGEVTAAGCLFRGTAVRGGPKNKDVLARPKEGPFPAFPRQRARPTPVTMPWTLDNTSKAGMNDKLLGRWVEITGKLEKETSKNPDNLRELDVASFKMIPVAAPPRPGPPATPPAAAPPRHPAAGTGGDASSCSGSTNSCTCSDTRRASQDSAEDGEPPSGDWFCRVALAGSGPHSSFVPSPATRLRHDTRIAIEGATAHAVAPFVIRLLLVGVFVASPVPCLLDRLPPAVIITPQRPRVTPLRAGAVRVVLTATGTKDRVRFPLWRVRALRAQRLPSVRCSRLWLRWFPADE